MEWTKWSRTVLLSICNICFQPTNRTMITTVTSSRKAKIASRPSVKALQLVTFGLFHHLKTTTFYNMHLETMPNLAAFVTFPHVANFVLALVPMPRLKPPIVTTSKAAPTISCTNNQLHKKYNDTFTKIHPEQIHEHEHTNQCHDNPKILAGSRAIAEH